MSKDNLAVSVSVESRSFAQLLLCLDFSSSHSTRHNDDRGFFMSGEEVHMYVTDTHIRVCSSTEAKDAQASIELNKLFFKTYRVTQSPAAAFQSSVERCCSRTIESSPVSTSSPSLELYFIFKLGELCASLQGFPDLLSSSEPPSSAFGSVSCANSSEMPHTLARHSSTATAQHSRQLEVVELFFDTLDHSVTIRSADLSSSLPPEMSCTECKIRSIVQRHGAQEHYATLPDLYLLYFSATEPNQIEDDAAERHMPTTTSSPSGAGLPRQTKGVTATTPLHPAPVHAPTPPPLNPSRYLSRDSNEQSTARIGLKADLFRRVVANLGEAKGGMKLTLHARPLSCTDSDTPVLTLHLNDVSTSTKWEFHHNPKTFTAFQVAAEKRYSYKLKSWLLALPALRIGSDVVIEINSTGLLMLKVRLKRHALHLLRNGPVEVRYFFYPLMEEKAQDGRT